MKTIYLPIPPGIHIQRAIMGAKRFAKIKRKPVRFHFRDIPLIITRKKSQTSVLREYEAAFALRERRWRRSLDFKKAEAAWINMVNALVDVLGTCQDPIDALACLAAFDRAAHLGTFILPESLPLIADKLESKGWGEAHGLDPDEAHKSRADFARYVVGETARILKAGSLPGELLGECAEIYQTIEQP